MSETDFNGHLNEVTRLELKLDSSIADLAKAADGEKQLEIKGEIKKLSRALEDRLDRARLCAEEQDSDGQRGAFLLKVNKHAAELESVSARVRRAMLQAKAGLDDAKAREREVLLGGSSWDSVNAVRNRNSAGSSKTLAKSAEVTESLNRLRKSLARDMERTAVASQTLESSSKVIASTQQETGSIDSRLSKARALLVRIGRRNCTDFTLVLFGVCIFLSVVMYIAKRRIYDRFF